MIDLKQATHGSIAAHNLEGARLHGWARFWRTPTQSAAAAALLDQELLTAQFCGDTSAFDRMETLANELLRVDPEAAETWMVLAQVASATHRFGDARAALARGEALGALPESVEGLSLAIDQATGTDMARLLSRRRERAIRPGLWEELVPLGALLGDLGEFDAAEQTFLRALREYGEISPFALAWACFELGVLWGERRTEPCAERAAQWYRVALHYLPCYVKARVHLAEILLAEGQTNEAECLLRAVHSSSDPEVLWRLSEVAKATEDPAGAETFMTAARSGFESLLGRHLLAFADHGAEFYLAGGADPARAFELALLNFSNRQTTRAYNLVLRAARSAGQPDFHTRLRPSPAGM